MDVEGNLADTDSMYAESLLQTDMNDNDFAGFPVDPDSLSLTASGKNIYLSYVKEGPHV